MPEEKEEGRMKHKQAAALSDDDNGDIKTQILLFLIQCKVQQFEIWTIHQTQGAALIGTMDSVNG